MTMPADIAWGAYSSYEGPFFRGTTPLRLPANPSQAMKRVYVSSSTEGLLDSINMYDKCSLSIGVSQACETPWFLTSMLVGAIAEKDLGLLAPLAPALAASNAEFKQTARGKWRFHFKDDRGEVDAGAEQKALFLLHSDGTKGTWDAASKAHGKLWAASMANMLVQPEAIEAQVEWVASRATLYAMPEAKKTLFDGAADDGWVGALRAAYLSYALNIPVKANEMLKLGVATAPGQKWSPDWCTHILQVMTFRANVAIWPHRYNAIRPHLEKLYGIDIPDSSTALKAWQADMGLHDTSEEDLYEEEPEAMGKEPTFTTTKEIQKFLLDQGYDLGPWGADGKMGAKTQNAVRTFQRLNKLTADGVVGRQTRAKMLEIWRAKS